MNWKPTAAGFALTALLITPAPAQITVPVPGRSLVKLLPDYLRPQVYALNRANGSVPGTLLALNSTNGAILNEISVNLNPTDMAMTPAGDALYVINGGSRTISKVDLTTFTLVGEKAVSTPNTYSLSAPLYLVAGQSERLYYTDGAWGPEIYFFDFNAGTNLLVLNTGGNQDFGAGGVVLNRSGDTLYVWKQYGWGAGNVNSWVTRYNASTNGNLTPLEDSFTSWRRDPLDTPLFLDAAERWVFNKEQMFAATNVSVLVNQFSDNIYGISLDGSVAFGPTEVFNAQTGTTLTNLPFSTTVQTLSGDQKKLFRYNNSTTSVVIFDMATIASVAGPNLVPTPADGSVVSPPLSNLTWTVSPLALGYDVFFGTNQSDLAAATTASPQYLGRVATPGQPLALTLVAGATYYWRVDTVGFDATNAGPVWSFTMFNLSVSPSQLSYSAIAGYNPAGISLLVTSTASSTWTAAVTGPSWLAITPASGNTPTNPLLTFATAGLAPGQYSNNIEFTASGLKLEMPVVLSVKALNITKLAADNQRPYLYALQPPPLTGQSGLLLFINTTNGNIDKTLTIGVNPVDLTINYPEGRLYIASWTETWTYVVDLATQSLLPPLNLGTDVYKINAGRFGRLVTEGEDQWVYVSLINTTNGALLTSGLFREGDGAFDPSGRYYYHGDNNISGAGITKYDTSADTFASVAGAGGHYYFGSRNVVMSQDGSRLFWTSAMYDSNLVDMGVVGAEIYSCSTNGAVAFGSSQAFDTATKQVIYNLPASTTVSVVDGQNQRFWYFDSATAALGSLPLTVIESPSITQQPAANTSVGVGGTVYLTVTAMGVAPLFYQWTMNGTNLSNQTNYFFSINSIQPAQQGDYQVIVSNPVGSVTSVVAHVTVPIAASIVSQSPSTNVVAGQTFSLSAVPGGTPPFTYRWLFENAGIDGALGPTLTVPNAQAGNEGIYQVVVGNSVGSATSAVISVRVLASAPLITSQPVSLTLPASSNATFSVSAVGSQPLGYQWFFGGNAITGASAAQFGLSGIQSSNSGDYRVVVNNSLGSVTSVVASLVVTPMLPYFLTQPADALVSAGANTSLRGLANGSQPIGYQWQRNATNLAGATQPSLVLSNVTMAQSGAYTLVASNIAGVSTSAVAQVTVYQNPTLTQALTNQVVDATSTVVLAVNAVGSPTLAYAWQWNGQPIGGSGPTLILTNVQVLQSGYYQVTATNQYGRVSSTTRVSVLGPPSSVTVWGDDSGGQTNVPAGLPDAVAAAGGDYHTLALRHDGTLLAWGYDGDGQTNCPTSALRFVSVASGANHNLAITENGGVVAWGRNASGQCNVPPAATSVLAVACGDAHSLALLASGSVLGWGDNSFGQVSIPQGLAGARAIAAGRNHSLALLNNGRVAGWGFNAFGQATPPAGLGNLAAVAAGYLHSVGLLSNSTVVVWGDNTYGQANVPAGLSNVVAVTAGDFHTLALRADGSLVAWGNNDSGQTNVPASVVGATSIASGNYHSMALIPSPRLLYYPAPSGLVFKWTGVGVLQSAPTPSGPYTNVPGLWQGNYTNTDLSEPAKFFRLLR